MRGPSAALLAMTLLWGTTFVVVKDALGHADPFSFLALRFLVGALLGTALVGKELLRGPTLRVGAVLGVLLFLGFALQTTGLLFTTPARSSFVTGLSVLMVPFVSWAVLRRVPRWSSVLGIALAVPGLYLLTGAVGLLPQARLGDALTLGAAVAFAGHIGLIEKWAPGHSAVALVTVQLWEVAALSALMALVSPGTHVTLNASLGGAVLVCGVFATTLAISVQTWAQARLPAVRAAIIYSLEPVFAAALSVGLGRETLSGAQVLGAVLILGGVLAAEGLSHWRLVLARG